MRKSVVWSKGALGFASVTLLASALAATALAADQADKAARISAAITKVNNRFMMTKQMAMDWNYYKAQAGPTYAGSPGWKSYTDFLVSTAQEFGLIDIDTVDAPYDHYIVNDWP